MFLSASITTFGLFITLVISSSSETADVYDPRQAQQRRLQPGRRGEKDTQEGRIRALRRTCDKFSDVFRPESAVLWGEPRGFGSEVVYLHSESEKIASVCVPHKVASNSWGKFGQNLLRNSPENVEKNVNFFNGLNFKERTKHVTLKAVTVRHPMERLLSVYRMIFEDWCDPDKFLAKQWPGRVCQFDDDDDEANLIKALSRSTSSASDLFAGMIDEHRHGNDRFLAAVWRRFHPKETLNDPKNQLKFTFSQFVRFLVNGTTEFPGYSAHKGLSYHWAPYWKECSQLCNPVTRPDFVLKMETLTRDLSGLLKAVGLEAGKIDLFPHTHAQKGGHSSDAAREYFGRLTKAEVMQLYDLYRLDHELFGYEIDEYLDMAAN